MMGEHKNTKNVLNRLARVEGHIRGIMRMIEEGKSCDEVLLQLSAVQAAISKTSKIVLEDHFDHCILENIKDEQVENQLVSFKKALESFMK